MNFIRFKSGTHGNFLRFAINATITNYFGNRPFTKLGSSHRNQTSNYIKAFHPTEVVNLSQSDKIIEITTTSDSVLPLSMILFLRCADVGIDINNVHQNLDVFDNTMFEYFKEGLSNFSQGYDLIDGYNAVKDDAWPAITSIEEFQNLPDWIQTECREIHNLTYVTANTIPKEVARVFFREHFFGNKSSKWVKGLFTYEKLATNCDTIEFPYLDFYDTTKFEKSFIKVIKWLEPDFCLDKEILTNLHCLHQDFLDRQPYKNSLQECNSIIQSIVNGEPKPIRPLYLLEEAYIESQLEQILNIQLGNTKWPNEPTNTADILNLFV
jgi:hypothetical protein